MRAASLIVILALCAACGSASIHYRVEAGLECLQRTNSTRAGGNPNSIFLLFGSDDGVSAVEPVFVSFGPAKLVGRVPTALAIPGKLPHWKERRGDARVSGYGPYEPRIAKSHGITDAQAKSAADKLDHEVRAAIDACLKQNER